METSNQDSIRSLLDELCKCIYKDWTSSQNAIAHRTKRPSVQHSNDNNHKIPEKLLKKCKIRSYEILLKKTHLRKLPNDLLTQDEGYSDIINPIRELKFSQFEYNIYVGRMRAHFDEYGLVNEKRKTKILKKHELYVECVKTVESDDYFRDEQRDGHSILTFLILLKNNCSEETSNASKCDESLFAIDFEQMPSFPTFQPKLFKLNWKPDLALHQNPYCSLMRKLNSSASLFHLPSQTLSSDRNRIQRNHIISSDIFDGNVKRNSSNTIYYTSNKWEELGRRYVLDENCDEQQFSSFFEKKFITESNSSIFDIMAIVASQHNRVFQARIVDSGLFIEHIKLLLIGVESESFSYDENTMSFNMFEHLTIKNVMPSTIAQFMDDFIECGTCYKRLKIIVSRNTESAQLKYKGFLFKVIIIF